MEFNGIQVLSTEPLKNRQGKRSGLSRFPQHCLSSSGGNLDLGFRPDRRPPRPPPSAPARGRGKDPGAPDTRRPRPGPAPPRLAPRARGPPRSPGSPYRLFDERLRAGVELGLRGPAREGPPRPGGRPGGRRWLPPHLTSGFPGPRAPPGPPPRASASRSAFLLGSHRHRTQTSSQGFGSQQAASSRVT